MNPLRRDLAEAYLCLLFLLALTACGPENEGARGERPDVTPRLESETGAIPSASTRPLPLYTVGEPLQEIGEFEGGGDQTLDFVADVTMIGDGRIAVVDEMAADILVYDTTGALTSTLGGRGDGPGEFRSPSDIRVLPGDSIRILDSWDQRVTILTAGFEYVRETHSIEPLVGRFVLSGAILEEERGQVFDALEAHAYPVEEPGIRVVALADDGTVWVRERLGSNGHRSLWVALGPDGTPVRAVEFPERFRPMYMKGDEIAGRWRGELNVHYVHRYRLEAAGRTVSLPAWMGRGSEASAGAPETPDSIGSFMRALLRNLATEQEIHYSVESSYTADLDPLAMYDPEQVPDGLALDMLYADGRGWAAVVTVAGHSGMCAITYGAVTVPGLRPGMVRCIP